MIMALTVDVSGACACAFLCDGPGCVSAGVCVCVNFEIPAFLLNSLRHVQSSIRP